jgi:hypothetical protein
MNAVARAVSLPEILDSTFEQLTPALLYAAVRVCHA